MTVPCTNLWAPPNQANMISIAQAADAAPVYGPITSEEFDAMPDAYKCLKCLVVNRRKRKMVKCTRCRLWAHVTCVNVKTRQADSLTTWNCPSCLAETNGTPGAYDLSTTPGVALPSDFAGALARLKANTRLLQRIPKACRILVADALTERLNTALLNSTPQAWWDLLSFTFVALRAPDKNKGHAGQTDSAATTVRKQIASNNLCWTIQLHDDPLDPALGAVRSDADNIAKRIEAKCNDGDIRAALRLLTSDDTFSPPSADTVAALQAKHPAAPLGQTLPPPPDNSSALALHVDSDVVYKAIMDMPAGSGGGLDGVRPKYIHQLVSKETMESGRRLLEALTKLVNLFLQGRIPECVRGALYRAALCALAKKEGGIRPIAVGSFYRRLSGRIAARHASAALAHTLKPCQLGVGVPQGCEAAIHSVREYASRTVAQPGSNHVLLKVDIRNAFNSIHRSPVLEGIREKCPDIYALRHIRPTARPLRFTTEHLSYSLRRASSRAIPSPHWPSP